MTSKWEFTGDDGATYEVSVGRYNHDQCIFIEDEEGQATTIHVSDGGWEYAPLIEVDDNVPLDALLFGLEKWKALAAQHMAEPLGEEENEDEECDNEPD